MPLLGPMGSLTASFIPAGRLRKPPLSPRALSCRIGPRRQGSASPLRALDGSGPIRKTRCLRVGKGGCRSASDFVSHLIAFDSIAPQTGEFGPFGRAEREPFGHTRRLEPQPRGAVTRRAVAKRRSRASGLTRLSAADRAPARRGRKGCRSAGPSRWTTPAPTGCAGGRPWPSPPSRSRWARGSPARR